MKNWLSLYDLGTTFETFVCITKLLQAVFQLFSDLAWISVLSVYILIHVLCLSGSITEILFIFKTNYKIHFFEIGKKRQFSSALENLKVSLQLFVLEIF